MHIDIIKDFNLSKFKDVLSLMKPFMATSSRGIAIMCSMRSVGYTAWPGMSSRVPGFDDAKRTELGQELKPDVTVSLT